MNATNYPIHPLWHSFPTDELYGLAEDIRRRGLLAQERQRPGARPTDGGSAQ